MGKASTRAGSVGRSVPRLEGAAKVDGRARYVDDLSFPGMLHGRTIRAPHACGRLRSVRLGPGGLPLGLVVVGPRDIPGDNVIAVIEDDQPALAWGEIRHAEEPVLLLAHADREALFAVPAEVEMIPGAPVFDPLASPRVFKHIRIARGDAGAALRKAPVVVEGEYRTGAQEHVYIEPNGVIAVPENGGITVHGSLQCPHYVHKALCRLLKLPADKVRVVQTETGGGFGGKEDYPSVIAGHAALLALKARRPVKIVYDRAEDMRATTKRHPSIVRLRTGFSRDGALLAIEAEVVMDGGAYVTLSPVVLSRGVLHATGPYRCPAVAIDGRVVMTNTPPNGAFRGFGAPQTQFAIEAHMDRCAEQLGIDPVKLREKNAFRPGDVTATGQKLPKDTSALPVLREAVRRSDFHRKRKAWAGTGKGIGLALFFHGSGFTGAGEVRLASRASLELTAKGARILVGSTEIGQGTRTMLAQIVADTLRWPLSAIEVAPADTGLVPDSGPTVASRTCMIVGAILQRAARELKHKLGRLTPTQYLARHGALVVTKQYEKPAEIHWDEERYKGDAYGTYAWGCDVVELEVDPVTREVRPLKLTAVQEIGKAIHPGHSRGQIEGGSAQGLGWALSEEVVMRDGKMANAQLTNYMMPTTKDTPEFDVAILEQAYRHGPFGAKGVGELPMDGPAPAVVNALRHAGFDVREVPATPERLLKCASR
ncbi:MAG: xanthine dehydrogenase family protein molybdopterin-binding subunit [Vicinamibacteria bacterium]|nr:xanthine dehydrogenase family protein molybdopterin-binding subunit [Vicinamibacteria bacterium]